MSGGEVEEYAIPYYDKVNNDPSFEEMKSVVCELGIRPDISERWADDEVRISFPNLLILCDCVCFLLAWCFSLFAVPACDE